MPELLGRKHIPGYENRPMGERRKGKLQYNQPSAHIASFGGNALKGAASA